MLINNKSVQSQISLSSKEIDLEIELHFLSTVPYNLYAHKKLLVTNPEWTLSEIEIYLFGAAAYKRYINFFFLRFVNIQL